MSKDLATVAGRLASADGATVASLLKGVAAFEAETSAFPVALPKQVAVTDDHARAAQAIVPTVRNLNLPVTRRALSVDEQEELGEALEVVKAMKGLVANAEASLRTALFNHADVTLESTGAVHPTETPRDKDGHYLIPFEGAGWNRSVTAPTPSTDAEALRDLEIEEILTHDEYLTATRQVRVVDERGLMGLIAKKPSLIGALRRAIKYSRRGSVSLKLS